MDNGIWTFFCRNGIYDRDYHPSLRRYTCIGGTSSVTAGTNGEGVGRKRLTLWLRERQIRLTDESGTAADLRGAAIQPGDRIAAGMVTDPEAAVCWQIVSVVPVSGGMGCSRGWVITAE